MKTKEFIKGIEELGCKVRGRGYINGKEDLIVYRKDNHDTVAYVCENVIYSCDTNRIDFSKLSKEIQKTLFELIVEYAATPIEEREEEMKFYLRFKKINDVCGNDYLNLPVFKNSVVIGNKIPKKNYKTIFTERDMGLLPYSFYQMIMQGHLVKEELE